MANKNQEKTRETFSHSKEFDPKHELKVHNAEGLNDSEEKYGNYMEKCPVAMFIVNSKGEYLDVNKAACDLLGYDKKEILNMSISALNKTETDSDPLSTFKQLKEKDHLQSEKRLLHKDGHLVDVLLDAIALENDRYMAFCQDISERKKMESEREITLKLLHKLYSSQSLHESLSEVLQLMRKWSGCDSVGIRLRQGEDYPYFSFLGFSEDFVQKENKLCKVDEQGEVVRDTQDNPILECMCGKVIRREFNPNLPCFTENGSFWTNSTTELLDSMNEQDLQTRPRGYCNSEGYESVALIPLSHGSETFGLLQFNDFRTNRFNEYRLRLFERLADSLAPVLAQRHALDTLQKREKMLRKSQEIAHVGSWELDLTTNQLIWSDESYRMFGLQPQAIELTYQLFLEMVHPEDRDKVDAAYRSSLEEDKDHYEIEHRIIRQDTGEIRYVNEKCEHVRDALGRIVRSEGITLDISEHKRNEAMLREKEDKFQALIDQTADMVILHDLEGNILEVNQRAVNQYGYSKEELLCMKVSDLDPDYCDREQDGKFWEEFGINEPYSFEGRHQRKNGSIFPVEVTISKIQLHDALLVMGLAKDITERKHYEYALIQAKEQAEKASKTKSDFLAKMSHEIRTPMNSILGFLRLMLFGELTYKQRKRAEVAKDSAESLLWLLNDLLDLSSIEAGKFTLHEKEFRPRRLLSNVIRSMELQASEKGLSISLKVDDLLPANLIGDSYRLKQVLINLLSNAIKYTEKGWISLEASMIDKDPSLRESANKAEILFAVRDTGMGIDEESLSSIFDYYKQGKHGSLSTEQGAGLGLAICKKITEQLGGSIQAQSEPGQGSAFFVQIPFKTNGDIAVETSSADPERWEEMPPLRILLVEDQKMNQIFTIDLLSSKGHSVDVAENGEQALEILSRKSFDLVLMDIKMPVMDGIEATRRIRTADVMIMNPDIPIIGLSAHALPQEEVEGFQSAGFDDYVVKPVSFEKLFAAMKKVVEPKKKI